MNGLNLQQEAALAIAWIHQDEGRSDFTSLGLSSAFVSLRDMGMIKIITDTSQELVLFQGMLPSGSEHYSQARKERRRFEVASDKADMLIMTLAVEDAAKRSSGATPFVSTDSESVPAYQELAQHGLIEVRWADDRPYVVQLTDKGRSYAEGWFQDQMNNESLNINLAPIFNNNSSVVASASAVIQDVTLGPTIGAIIDLDIDQGIKTEAQEAVKQLDEAAKNKDKATFAEKLERVANIAKSSLEIASVILPFVGAALKTLLA